MDVLADPENVPLLIQLHEALVPVAGRRRQKGAEGAFRFQKGGNAFLLKHKVAFQKEEAAFDFSFQQAQAVHGARPLIAWVFHHGHIAAPRQVLPELFRLKAGDDEKPPNAAVLQHPHGPIQHRFLSQRQQRRRKVEILPPAGRKDHRRPDRLLFLRQGELHLLPGKECSFQHPAPLLR